MQKTGMVLHVVWQIAQTHVRMVAHARHQTHVHVHLNGITNIVCPKLSLSKFVYSFLGADQPARCPSVFQRAKIVEHVRHQMFVLGKYSSMFFLTYVLTFVNCFQYKFMEW